MRAASSKPGYIYAMESGGLVKLGFSKNPDVRKYAVGQDISAPVRLAFKIPVKNMARCEAAVHDRLKDKRAHGEWFTVSIEEAIECLKWAAENPKSPAVHCVCFRLDEDEMAALDRARGAKSRADYVLGLVRKAAGL